MLKSDTRSYSKLTIIQKQLRNTLFSTSVSNDIAERPRRILKREQYQKNHGGKKPHINCCLRLCYILSCTPTNESYDYEISTQQRYSTTRILIDRIKTTFTHPQSSSAPQLKEIFLLSARNSLTPEDRSKSVQIKVARSRKTSQTKNFLPSVRINHESSPDFDLRNILATNGDKIIPVSNRIV